MAAQHGGAGPVGMVGLGNMGGRITRRMVDAGHEVWGVDRVVDALGDLAGGVRVSGQTADEKED